MTFNLSCQYTFCCTVHRVIFSVIYCFAINNLMVINNLHIIFLEYNVVCSSCRNIIIVYFVVINRNMGRIHLTLEKKGSLLEDLKNGAAASFLAKKYGVSKSTVFSIKNRKSDILKRIHFTYSGSGKSKTLRKSEVDKMERVLYKWFLKMRENHLPVDGKILKQKAILLHSKFYPKKSFNASDGWLTKFKTRHGIRLLRITGEKLSARSELVEPFLSEIAEKVRSLNLCHEQIYNADESSLYWKLLPNKTFVSSSERNAPGRKASKDRITFLACTNATGNHKVKLLVIGKSKSPRSFKNFVLPVDYDNSVTAWMTTYIFDKWFHKKFVPQVHKYLKSINLQPKALLLIDNAPCHSLVKSNDGNIITVFMPPNVTPLIQPMDQNVIRVTKLKYRNGLLTSLISHEPTNFEKRFKKLTLKDAVIYLSQAWNDIEPSLIAKCYKTILCKLNEEEDNEDDDDEDTLPLSILQMRLRSDVVHVEINRAVQLLNALDLRDRIIPSDIDEWNRDQVQDENIEVEIDESLENDMEVSSSSERKVNHIDAINSINKIIQWSEQNDIAFDNISSLFKLREIAVMKSIQVKTTQTKIQEFFKKL